MSRVFTFEYPFHGLGDGSNPSRIDSIKYRTRDNAESITQIDFLSRNDIEENQDDL